MPASFVDSNVLLYLASDNAEKADRAEQILKKGDTISVQVLNEVGNVARRKMRLSWAKTRDFLTLLRSLLEVRAVTIETHQSGLILAERYGLSVFDAMIAASALAANCGTLWSEDMHHGLIIQKRLRIANPFLGDL